MDADREICESTTAVSSFVLYFSMIGSLEDTLQFLGLRVFLVERQLLPFGSSGDQRGINVEACLRMVIKMDSETMK